MEIIRWGILGCGRIARKFAADLALVDDATLTAVGARQLDDAKTFANEFPAPHVHGSYEELVSNPDVDVIYIASPHALHHEHTLLCLNHQKAVLCEKAFALNLRQAKEMVAVSRNRKVFLMEALWSKFLPQYQKLKDLIASGELGEIKSVLVNFGFIPQPPVPSRLFDPALGGGSLLDIGIYNVFLVLSVLGRPDIIEASMTATPEGVDEQCAVFSNIKMVLWPSFFHPYHPTSEQTLISVVQKAGSDSPPVFMRRVQQLNYLPEEKIAGKSFLFIKKADQVTSMKHGMWVNASGKD